MYDLFRGVRVIEVASWVFVPSAGAVLADWGADVIKVEQPDTGDPLRGLENGLVLRGGGSAMYETSNRGKRSIGIDLTSAEGREVLGDLIRSADVFLTNLRKRARDMLGLGSDEVRAHNSRIIYALGTGYGSRGSDADKPAFDAAASWARAGIAAQMADETGTPPMVPGSIGDLVAGLSLAAGVAAALMKRERGGDATEVEASLLSAGMWLMAQSITAEQGPGLPARRELANNPLSLPYRTRDGQWIQLAMLQSDRAWSDLCRRLGAQYLASDPRFATAERRRHNHSACIAALGEVFAGKDASHWLQALNGIDGIWDLVQAPREVRCDAQALANGYLPEVERPDGNTYRAVASPVQFGGEQLGAITAAPAHGAHTEDLLLELGYSWDRIGSLKDTGAIL